MRERVRPNRRTGARKNASNGLDSLRGTPAAATRDAVQEVHGEGAATDRQRHGSRATAPTVPRNRYMAAASAWPVRRSADGHALVRCTERAGLAEPEALRAARQDA